MFKIGFEIECISDISKITLRSRLKKEFKKYKIQLIGDSTIFPTDSRPHSHEIITPPLPKDEAIQLLKDLFAFCKRNNCVSNISTGLHINVSFEDPLLNKWLNPMHVIDCVDYSGILNKWGREKRLYSRSFDYYFKNIDKQVDRHYNPQDWSDPYAVSEYSKEEVKRASRLKFLSLIIGGDDISIDKYNSKAYYIYDDKHICINLNYLVTRGYIEYRMVGGAKYLKNLDLVLEDLDSILISMYEAQKRSMQE